MNYAIIDGNSVTNIIILDEKAANDFPDAVPCQDKPVQIGDEYIGGEFYRGGSKVIPIAEQQIQDLLDQLTAARAESADMQAALAEALTTSEIAAAIDEGVNSI